MNIIIRTRKDTITVSGSTDDNILFVQKFDDLPGNVQDAVKTLQKTLGAHTDEAVAPVRKAQQALNDAIAATPAVKTAVSERRQEMQNRRAISAGARAASAPAKAGGKS